MEKRDARDKLQEGRPHRQRHDHDKKTYRYNSAADAEGYARSLRDFAGSDDIVAKENEICARDLEREAPKRRRRQPRERDSKARLLFGSTIPSQNRIPDDGDFSTVTKCAQARAFDPRVVIRDEWRAVEVPSRPETR